MMAELRKYGVGLVMAHQYRRQLTPEVRHAVRGHAGNIFSIPTGPQDAPLLTDVFQRKFGQINVLSLPN